jgi:hypothetical protein
MFTLDLSALFGQFRLCTFVVGEQQERGVSFIMATDFRDGISRSSNCVGEKARTHVQYVFGYKITEFGQNGSFERVDGMVNFSHLCTSNDFRLASSRLTQISEFLPTA